MVVNRTTGFSGAIDIDATVKKLMDAERIPLDKLQQQKQTLQWQTDQYRDINLALDDFRSSIVTGVGLQSTFNAKTVTSSNESIVSAVSKGGTSNTINSIDSITQLATSTRWNSGVISKKDTSLMQSTSLISELDPANYANPFSLQFDVIPPGSPAGTTPTLVKIDIDPTKDTMQDVVNKMNNSALGVSAFFDDKTGKMVLTNNNTGAGGSIVAHDTDSTAAIAPDPTTVDFMNTLNFSVGVNGELNTPLANQGQDAKFTINGLPTSRSTNTFSIGDVTYTLKQTYTPGSPAPITVSTTTDTQKIFDSVKAFVDKYNDLIKKINDKVTEPKYRDFPPLTDAQKAAMKDTDITNWQNKAQSGLLRSDSVLTGVLNTIRTQLYAPVNGLPGAVKQLSQIGITTSSNYLDNGKLIISEDKLKQAITNDPASVSNLFTGIGTTDSTPSDQQGLATRLKTSLKSTIDSIAQKAGKASYVSSMYLLGKSMTDLNTRISNFQDHLTQVENRYYTQYNAMDQAIQKANSQSTSLSQYFK
ncbi:flagellar hook-associated protein 2 [Bacillus sp. RG28]|uniref:Flagellar hook-associated protein 2 n=1 Tax=Gottfriedia endophytica TaxID=2820819 RepID=A0A940NQ27_9BACI|nr:flagellar hook-associated protein 2 [Gottfriedia endophytica]MBP0726726.1 flagellar hook-associated protein 2 [Gottfriedia endophytica]